MVPHSEELTRELDGFMKKGKADSAICIKFLHLEIGAIVFRLFVSGL